jgi:hypothetical protein
MGCEKFHRKARIEAEAKFYYGRNEIRPGFISI